MLRSFVAVLVLAVAPIAARAAEEENPYKNSKVGDFATYTMTTTVMGITIDGTITQTVTKKDDKEATIKITGVVKFGGNEMKFPEQEQKIDLTKPFDPTKLGAGQQGGADVKVEKGKEGKEKIKAGGKEYATTWTTYKVKGKANGVEFDSDMKVWMAKDVPAGVAKMEMTSNVLGMKVEMTMELSETGNKK